MTAATLGALWAAVVAGAAWRHRPPRRSVSDQLRARHGAGAPASSVPGPLDRIGRLAGQGGALVRRLARRAPDPAADRRLGLALAAGVFAMLVSPALAPVVAAAVWARPAFAARRDRRRRRDEIVGGLPDVVDLFRVAVGAGLTVPLAVPAVAARATGPVGEALRRVASAVALGRRTAEALDDLPGMLGEPVRPLVSALVASERYGAPLDDVLDRLANEVRLARRRRAEEAARRVPVQLLFPLVLLILPAFALLTVVPLLAGAVRSLRL